MGLHLRQLYRGWLIFFPRYRRDRALVPEKTEEMGLERFYSLSLDPGQSSF